MKLSITSCACAICGRELKDPASVADGIGPVCKGTKPRMVKRFKLLKTLDMFKANFNYSYRCDVLVIYDLDNGGRSVTNEIENVLREIATQNQLPKIVIYRDTQGIFDGINHDAGRFTGFYSINLTNESQAIEKARDHGAQHQTA